MDILGYNMSLSGMIALVVGLLVAYRFARRDKKNYPPGPPGLPILGNILSLVFTKRQQHEVLCGWQEKYGPIIQLKFLTSRVVVIADQDLVKEAFHHNADIAERFTFPPADAITGKTNTSAIFSNGPVWKKQRRFILNTLRGADKLQMIVDEVAETLILKINKQEGKSLDPNALVSTSNANVISKLVIGATYDDDDAQFQKLIRSHYRVFELMGAGGIASEAAAGPLLSKIPFLTAEINAQYKNMYDFTKRAIDVLSASYDPSEEPTNSIEMYLREKARQTAMGSWTELDNINFEMTLVDSFLGGLETPSTTFLWILHTMATHPEDQQRVRNEIHAVVGDRRRAVFSDLESLPITEATIAECMRYRPIANYTLTHAASRDCKIGGYDVQRGTLVTSSIWYFAQSPKFWDNPGDFRPSRFLDNSVNREPNLMMTFGYGRRACPGEQLARITIFTFLAYILQSFIVTLPDGALRENPGKHGITCTPCPYKIKFTKIKL